MVFHSDLYLINEIRHVASFRYAFLKSAHHNHSLEELLIRKQRSIELKYAGKKKKSVKKEAKEEQKENIIEISNLKKIEEKAQEEGEAKNKGITHTPMKSHDLLSPFVSPELAEYDVSLHSTFAKQLPISSQTLPIPQSLQSFQSPQPTHTHTHYIPHQSPLISSPPIDPINNQIMYPSLNSLPLSPPINTVEAANPIFESAPPFAMSDLVQSNISYPNLALFQDGHKFFKQQENTQIHKLSSSEPLSVQMQVERVGKIEEKGQVEVKQIYDPCIAKVQNNTQAFLDSNDKKAFLQNPFTSDEFEDPGKFCLVCSLQVPIRVSFFVL